MRDIKIALETVWYGAPVWAWLFGLLIALQEYLARSRFKSNTVVQVLGNICARGRLTILARFPIIGQILWFFALGSTPASAPTPAPTKNENKSAPLSMLFLMVLLGSTGCATTKTILADEAAKCGGLAVSAIQQTEGVLEVATSADAAIAAIAQIIGAASTDVQAIYCIVKVAYTDLKGKKVESDVTTPEKAHTLFGGPSYPPEITAHGIAVAEDVLSLLQKNP